MTTVHETIPTAYEPDAPPVPETDARPAKAAINWRNEPTVALVNEVLRPAIEKVSKGGLGAYLEVAEADRPGEPVALPVCDHDPDVTLVNCPGCAVKVLPVPEPDPIPGCSVRVVVPSAEDAQRLRSQLGSLVETEVEESTTGPGAALYLWVPGLHGRVGTYTNHRCRQEILCQAAWRQKNQDMKTRRRAMLEANPDVVPHGLPTTYTNWLCRGEFCDGACPRAWAADAHERKQRARLRRVVVLVGNEGGQITAERRPGETVVYASLPSVDAAEKVARLVAEQWVNSQRHGFQVTFMVDTQLAVDLKLVDRDGDLVAG